MKNLPVVLYVDHDEQRLENFKSTFKNVMSIHTARSCAEAGEIIDRSEIHVLISPIANSEMPGCLSLQESVRLRPKPIRLLLGKGNESREFLYVPGLNYPVKILIPPCSETQLIEAVFEASFQYQSISVRDIIHSNDLDYLDTVIRRLEEVVRNKRRLIRNLIDQA